MHALTSMLDSKIGIRTTNDIQTKSAVVGYIIFLVAPGSLISSTSYDKPKTSR